MMNNVIDPLYHLYLNSKHLRQLSVSAYLLLLNSLFQIRDVTLLKRETTLAKFVAVLAEGVGFGVRVILIEIF